jgi:hypothetical protein
MKMPKMKVILTALSFFTMLGSFAFCGFYVAKADATLFNNKSEVILVRDGNKTVITMSNDFKGNMRDFAMVVPVPVVLKEKDIKVVSRRVFDVLDEYSSPRLVEYYDNNPCYHQVECDKMVFKSVESRMEMIPTTDEESAADMGVTIEASYTIGEYDILILSATESDGLKDWLLINGYKIPETADQVLQPYIKSNMKFFVVKVNLDNVQGAFEYLNPLQISFEHEKFMLPIRLGMANSSGEQDMIVYAFTKNGRIECTNYRTVKMPTDRNIPLHVQSGFGEFYKSLFQRTYRHEGRNSVFLEYAWNVSPTNAGVKCDPCVGPPPIYNDFAEAGVSWALNGGVGANVFFTRLHVRYSRDKFPSDLTFQETPNNENFQCRYILTHPAQGPFDCDEAQSYLETLQSRRKKELDEYYALTGKNDPMATRYLSEYAKYLKQEPVILEDNRDKNVPKEKKKNQDDIVVWTPDERKDDPNNYLPAVGFVLFILVIMRFASTQPKLKSEVKQS